MAITTEFNKMRIIVTNDIDGYANVVTRLFWYFEFTDTETGKSVTNRGETTFDVSDLSGFVDVDSITDAQYEEWVMAKLTEGGDPDDNGWTNMLAHNTERLALPQETIYWSDPTINPSSA